ncbi:BTAD domain-containing putative transcriptional regulator [Krasilnikovia sp. MM14-A1259]|uniref:AfsR/SARP family transcriptional regulator n=1 Tax=Krasilnikovia sp. MM14-A1259 TaxID=3373539 RepID=UPI00382C9F0A
MEFRLLGRMEADQDGRRLELGRRRERALLAVLLLEAGSVVPVERLVDLLWDEDPPATARANLHTHVSRLRAHLDRDGTGAWGFQLISGDGGYRADVDRQAVDVHRFHSLVDDAGRMSAPGQRAAILRQALALWRGPLLADVASERLRDRIGTALAEQRVTTVELAIDAELADGRHGEVIAELTALTAEFPLRERFVGQLMRALHGAGRAAEALECYAAIRQRLAEELGVDPGPELQQLHLAILRGDLGLPRQPPAVPVPAQLPVDVHGFAGRDAELDRLDAVLAAGSEQPTAVLISAVSGTAGVGKTALAVHWAYRVAERFPDGQLYVNLRGFGPDEHRATPSEAVCDFLGALGVPVEKIPATLDAQAALYRSLLAGRRVLVVLDNARDAEQVRPLLPGTPTALAVVTSRNQLTPLVATEGARPIALDTLSTEEARTMLERRLGTGRITAEPEAVDRIIAACARLPLAIAIAAARAEQSGFPLAVVAGELEKHDRLLETLDAGDPASRIRAVFSWSYRELTPPAAAVFRLFGLHPGPDMSAAVGASMAGCPPREARRLLTELARANLLTEYVPGRYTAHDLLRAYAAELVQEHDDDPARHGALGRMLDHYLHSACAADKALFPLRNPSELPLPTPDPDSHPERFADADEANAWLRAELRNLMAAQSHADTTRRDTYSWLLAWALDTFLDREGLRGEEITAWQYAAQAAKRLDNPAARADALRYLGRAHLHLNQYAAAQSHLRQAFALFTEVGILTGAARTALHLSYLEERQDHLEEAHRYNEQGLALYEASGQRRGQADALNAVGWTHGLLGRYAEALAYCSKALVVLEEIGHEPGVAATLDSIGYSHHHLGDHVQAADYYHRAIALYRKLDDRYYEAATLVHLGDNHDAAGDPAAARDAWQQALDTFTELDMPDAASVRAKLQASRAATS